MSLSTIFQISSQGMSAQRERLEAASANLANSNTTRTAEGGAYRRRDVILESASVRETSAPLNAPFASLFDNSAPGFFSETNAASAGVTARVQVAEAGGGARHYEPGHPDADADGYVQMPDVDALEETVNMLSAARAFESNATAFSTAKEMARASLKLGEA